ncbi:GNAT family N-acetyltransferase [Nocardioides solisilvae]|uniref:GNAT family N-acetyltransferase n=1 Tax=Nocardioides solisilvae TaxID=1542435 RepID=UPI000D7483E3|nr:GNAT family N-acetyltransferase [Nocardioides solisilvae]
MPQEVRLRDGTEAWVLRLERTDRERLAEAFRELSPESRRLRFLAPMTRLSDSMLSHLVDDVDGVDHVALVLVAETAPDVFDPVAIGRMVRYPDLPDAADLAVTVKDDWQGRGVASALLPVLVAKRPPGVTRVLTEVLQDNPASLAMLRRLGPVTVHPAGHGVNDVEVLLEPAAPRVPVVEVSLPPAPGTTGAEPADRLHAVLADPGREHLRTRDLICPWLAGAAD